MCRPRGGRLSTRPTRWSRSDGWVCNFSPDCMLDQPGLVGKRLRKTVVVCGLLNVPATYMLVYLWDGSARTIVRAATLRQKLQIKLAISHSHSTLTRGQPVQSLALYRQAPGKVAPGRKRDSNPGLPLSRLDSGRRRWLRSHRDELEFLTTLCLACRLGQKEAVHNGHIDTRQTDRKENDSMCGEKTRTCSLKGFIIYYSK